MKEARLGLAPSRFTVAGELPMTLPKAAVSPLTLQVPGAALII